MSNEVISFNHVPDYVEFHGAIEGAIYSKQMSCPNTDIRVNIIPVNNLTHEEVPVLESIVSSFDNIDLFLSKNNSRHYLSDAFESILYKEYSSDIPLHKILNVPHTFHGLSSYSSTRLPSALDDYYKKYTEFTKKSNLLESIDFHSNRIDIKKFFHMYADILLLVRAASNPDHEIRKEMKSLKCEYLSFNDSNQLFDFNSFALQKEDFPFNINKARKHLLKTIDLVSTFRYEKPSYNRNTRQYRRLVSYLLEGSKIITSMKKAIAKIVLPSVNIHQPNNLLNLFVCFTRGNNDDAFVYKNILEDAELMDILQKYDTSNIRTMYTPIKPDTFFEIRSINNRTHDMEYEYSANIITPFLRYTLSMIDETNKYNATHGFLKEFFDRMTSFLEEYGYVPVSSQQMDKRLKIMNRIFSNESKSIRSFQTYKDTDCKELRRLNKLKDFMLYDKGSIDSVAHLMFMISIMNKHLEDCLDVFASKAHPNSLYCFKILDELSNCIVNETHVGSNLLRSCFEEIIEHSGHSLSYYVNLFKQVFFTLCTLSNSQRLESIEKYFDTYRHAGKVTAMVYTNTGKDIVFTKEFVKRQMDAFGRMITISDVAYAGGKSAMYIGDIENRLRDSNKNERLRSSIRKFYDNEKENDMFLYPVYQNGIHKPLAALAAIPSVQRFLIRNKEGRPEYISADGVYHNCVKHMDSSDKKSYTTSLTLKDQLIKELDEYYEPKTVKLSTDIVAYQNNIESTYTNILNNLVTK